MLHIMVSRAKVKADIFIDDRNLGGLPDWGDIYRMIQKKLTYEELYRNMDEAPQERKAGSGAGLVFRSALKNQGRCAGNEVRLSFGTPPFYILPGRAEREEKPLNKDRAVRLPQRALPVSR